MSDSPNLADALTGLSADPPARSRCTVGLLLEHLAATDRGAHDALVQTIDHSEIPAGPITTVLSDPQYDTGGHLVQSQTVRRHRKRQRNDGCKCPWPWAL